MCFSKSWVCDFLLFFSENMKKSFLNGNKEKVIY